jgi:hypothetical protein
MRAQMEPLIDCSVAIHRSAPMRACARVNGARARSEMAIVAGMLSGFSTARADRCLDAGL